MDIRHIVTHWAGAAEAATRLAAAETLATRFGAGLEVVCFGLEPAIPAYAFADPAGLATFDFRGEAEAEATQLTAEAGKALTGTVQEVRVRKLVGFYDRAAIDYGAVTRFADLVLAGAPTVGDHEHLRMRLLEGALFDGDTLVLVCPEGGLPAGLGQRVVVGWDGSREALRAVRRALPFLKGAAQVEVVTIGTDPAPDAEGDGAGSLLAAMLARQGVAVRLTPLAEAPGGAGQTLAAHATATGADLIVMGGWGHSRFREFILGGATRTLLADLPVPLLMAH